MDAMMQACQKAIGCMLFEGVEQAQTLHLLQTYAQLQTFEKGQIIYSPGHYQHSLGIIVRGRTVVEKECGVLLNDLGAGQCFGAAALFVPQDQYVTTVRAKPAVPSCFCRWNRCAKSFCKIRSSPSTTSAFCPEESSF